MLDKRTQVPKDILFLKQSSSTDTHKQHGNISILDIPTESLTHITSFLDLPSLLALSRVDSLLYAHVKNDNTWHRAFVYQFLGILPETNLEHVKTLMLRKTERSWRNEFILQYNLRRRWERSRNTTTTHIPHYGHISNIHLMPSQSLLTSSIQYGIVSRSIPLTGKILRGYLDASGTSVGMGVGNPNAEFAPDVSMCALSSDGGTAKIIWGFRSGTVAVMTAPKAMDAAGRSTAKLLRCRVTDQHQAAVRDVVWDEPKGAILASAGDDGRVKIWNAKEVTCIWTSERKGTFSIADGYCKVAIAIHRHVIAAASNRGEIVLWSGFDGDALLSDEISCLQVIKEIRIPAIQDDDTVEQEATALYIDSTSSSIAILVTFSNDPYFHRFLVNSEIGSVVHTRFGDASFGPISSLRPFFATQPGEFSFILAGDHLGCVSVYEWDAIATPCVAPAFKFEAEEDGSSIVALAWNGVTLVTGSMRGTVKVFDALTFAHLRSFASPIPRVRRADQQAVQAVKQILISPERDVLVVAVGDRVMAWRAGPVGLGSRGGVRGRHAVASSSHKSWAKAPMAKYAKQVELHQSINESKRMIEQERKSSQRALGRERAQREQLQALGLDEIEAVEYVLMVSRDEEERRRLGEGGSGSVMEEGIFQDDFEDASPALANSSPVSPPTLLATASLPSNDSSHREGRPIPRVSPDHKIQVSPRFRAVPSQASPTQASPLLVPTSITSKTSHFPPIAPEPCASAIPMSRSPSGSRSIAGSIESAKSAWSTPLAMSTAPSPRSSVPRRNRIEVPSHSPGSEFSGSPDSRRSTQSQLEELDEDMRFAIELSLAEARSRGDAVDLAI